jgi:hypothetical protein
MTLREELRRAYIQEFAGVGDEHCHYRCRESRSRTDSQAHKCRIGPAVGFGISWNSHRHHMAGPGEVTRDSRRVPQGTCSSGTIVCRDAGGRTRSGIHCDGVGRGMRLDGRRDDGRKLQTIASFLRQSDCDETRRVPNQGMHCRLSDQPCSDNEFSWSIWSYVVDKGKRAAALNVEREIR